MSLFAREAKKYAIIQPVRKYLWDDWSEDQQQEHARDLVMSSAHRSPDVTGVLEDTFDYGVVPLWDPRVFGITGEDPSDWVVVRASVYAFPAEGVEVDA